MGTHTGLFDTVGHNLHGGGGGSSGGGGGSSGGDVGGEHRLQPETTTRTVRPSAGPGGGPAKTDLVSRSRSMAM